MSNRLAAGLGGNPFCQTLTIFGRLVFDKFHIFGSEFKNHGDLMKRLTADQVMVGFIGLGNMGGRIAQRLLDHGYRLSMYDTDFAKSEPSV